MESSSYLSISEFSIIQASIIRTQALTLQPFTPSLAIGDGLQDTISAFWMQMTSRKVTLRPHNYKPHNSVVAEDSSLLGCYATPSGKQSPTFRRIVVPSSSGKSSPLKKSSNKSTCFHLQKTQKCTTVPLGDCGWHIKYTQNIHM
jgi:hypothetical protein